MAAHCGVWAQRSIQSVNVDWVDVSRGLSWKIARWQVVMNFLPFEAVYTGLLRSVQLEPTDEVVDIVVVVLDVLDVEDVVMVVLSELVVVEIEKLVVLVVLDTFVVLVVLVVLMVVLVADVDVLVEVLLDEQD